MPSYLGGNLGYSNTFNFNLKVPQLLLWVAGASCAYQLFKQVRCLKNTFMSWLFSFFNSKKFLSTVTDRFPNDPRLQQRVDGGENKRSFAVIYGAANKAGKAFSYYLMSQGFNLILIERDLDSLKDLHETLLRMNRTEYKPIIHKIVLNRFDQETIDKATGEYSTLPVKIFVNCKSSKKTATKKRQSPEEIEKMKKAILKESMVSNMQQVKQIIEEDDEISNFEISTRAEVHYTGKENIEGFASLVNVFLRSLLMTSKHPCLINVDNIDSNQVSQLKMEDGQIFYHATLEFKDTFTALLS